MRIFTSVLFVLFSFHLTFAQSFIETVKIPHSDSPQDVKVGDLNGDGFNDLVVASIYDNEISWYENQGDDTFKWQHIIAQNLPNASNVEIADFDGDGDMDVLGASLGYFSSGDLRPLMIYRNDGQGNSTSHSIDAFWSIDGLGVADIDKNGTVDIVTYDMGDDGVYWLSNDGTGNFDEKNYLKTVHSLEILIVEDINNDNQQDVIIQSHDSIGTLLNQANGEFTYKSITSQTCYRLAVADIDGDGDKDLLATEPSGGYIYWMQINDINKDGKEDILLFRKNGDRIRWMQNNGEGNFTSHLVTDFIGTDYNVKIGDMNGDGLKDIVHLNSSADSTSHVCYI